MTEEHLHAADFIESYLIIQMSNVRNANNFTL